MTATQTFSSFAGWVQDPDKLDRMAGNARAAAAPLATQEIANDLLQLLEEAP